VKIILRSKIKKNRSQDWPKPRGRTSIQIKNETVLESTDTNEKWSLLTEQVLEDIAKFQINGSGWTFHSIVAHDIHTVGYEPLNEKFLASSSEIYSEQEGAHQHEEH